MSFSFYKELNLYFEKKIKDDYLRKAFINKYFYNLTLNEDLEKKLIMYEFLLNP